MIPKIIHQIWLSDVTTMPEVQKEYCTSWQKHNPTFEYKLWDDSIWDVFGGRAFWNQKLKLQGVHPGVLTDVLRALVIDKFGGIYADTDTICHQSVDCLLNTDILLAYDYHGIVMGGFFGGSSNNLLTTTIVANFSSEGELLSRIGCQLFNKVSGLMVDETHSILGANRARDFFTHHYACSWAR